MSIGVKETIFCMPDNPAQCYAKGYNKNMLAVPGLACLVAGIAIIAYSLRDLAIFT
jgi:hypothetical protein